MGVTSSPLARLPLPVVPKQGPCRKCQAYAVRAWLEDCLNGCSGWHELTKEMPGKQHNTNQHNQQPHAPNMQDAAAMTFRRTQGACRRSGAYVGAGPCEA